MGGIPHLTKCLYQLIDLIKTVEGALDYHEYLTYTEIRAGL